MNRESCSILWISVRKPESPLSPPLESAFIRCCESVEKAAFLIKEFSFDLIVISDECLKAESFEGEDKMNENFFANFKKQTGSIPIVIGLEKQSMAFSLKMIGHGVQDVFLWEEASSQELARIFSFALERSRWHETQRWLEKKLFEARKLENLRSLGSKIAGDFDSLIQGVVRNAHLAQKKLSTKQAALGNLKKVETYALRASELTSQILAFSGKSVTETSKINWSKLIWEMKSIFESFISKTTEIEYEFDEETPLIEGDLEQLRQVVLCLVRNANESIHGNRGHIHISTKEIIVKKKKWTTGDAVLHPGKYVCLTIADTGKGVDASIRSRILEPFFTTKISAKGVGLSIVQGIVLAHNGILEIKPIPQGGTEVNVFFNAAQI